jgi:hypothetical protein
LVVTVLSCTPKVLLVPVVETAPSLSSQNVLALLSVIEPSQLEDTMVYGVAVPVVFMTPQVPMPIGAGATGVSGDTTPFTILDCPRRLGRDTAARGMWSALAVAKIFCSSAIREEIEGAEVTVVRASFREFAGAGADAEAEPTGWAPRIPRLRDATVTAAIAKTKTARRAVMARGV